MATWTGAARSHFFRVKDEQLFRAWAETLPAGVWNKLTEGEQHFSIYPRSSHHPGWYLNFPNEADKRSYIEQVATQLAPHLAEESVAVLIEVGFERLRMLIGIAVAVNSRGEIRAISTDEIYNRGEALAKDITEAAD